MADSVAGKGSLVNAFKKINHYRMVLMDVAMIGVCVGTLVATGLPFGFGDFGALYAKMHVMGFDPLVTSGPDFLSTAFAQANQEVWYTGVDAPLHSMHAAAPAAVAPIAAAPVTAPAMPLVVPQESPPVMDHSMHMMPKG
jgi:hypothetical protein